MNLKQQARENNKKYISKVAFELFSQNGIENVSIPQVAKAADVGTTSVYRYFETKLQLVVAAAMSACTQIEKTLIEGANSEVFMRKTGLEQAWYLLGGYLKLYDTNRNFLRFIYDFDNYLSLQDLDFDVYEKYKNDVQVVEPFFMKAIRKGIEDGTIKESVNPELVFSTVSDFILGFCSRIAYFEVYRQRKTVAVQREQLALSLEITYTYLKK